MKIYNSFDEIEFELKKLSLERQIAVEELRARGYELKEELKPVNWILSILKLTKKFGIIMLLKKIFK